MFVARLVLLASQPAKCAAKLVDGMLNFCGYQRFSHYMTKPPATIAVLNTKPAGEWPNALHCTHVVWMVCGIARQVPHG